MQRTMFDITYDTQTAKLLAEIDNGLSPDDFQYLHKAIYVTDSGDHFIYVQGGADTVYAFPSHAATKREFGEQIIPTSAKHAVKLAKIWRG